MREAKTGATGGHRRSGLEQSLQHGESTFQQARIGQNRREGD